MLKALKRWLARAAYDGLHESRANKLQDMFHENMPAVVAFKIDNGFVVRTTDPETPRKSVRSSGFVYCADHKAVADYIVSTAMKQKLSLQSDTFEEEKYAAVPQYAVPQSRDKTVAK